jgi:thymidylate kinase
VTELAGKPITAHTLKRGLLVSISGIDGSGKSSNTVALCKSLRAMGFSVTRAWTGHKPIFSYPFFAVVRLLGYTHRIRFRGIVFFRREIRQNNALATLWPFFVALDFVLKGIVSVIIPLRRGRIVVSDRYVYDVVAELIQEAQIGDRNILLNFLRRPDIAFLMDVSPELAWERAMVPGRAREQPYYDIAERRRIYQDLARQNQIIILDGSRDLSSNERDVLRWTLEMIQATSKS